MEAGSDSQMNKVVFKNYEEVYDFDEIQRKKSSTPCIMLRNVTVRTASHNKLVEKLRKKLLDKNKK